jgi:hypothetical protein
MGLRLKAALHYQGWVSSRRAKIFPPVNSTCVSSVAGRGSTQRSRRCSVPAVLRLERHGGRGELLLIAANDRATPPASVHNPAVPP